MTRIPPQILSQIKQAKAFTVTHVSEGGPVEIAELQTGDKIMQMNSWAMTMITRNQRWKQLIKYSEEVSRLLVMRQSLQKVVQQSMLS